MKDPTGTCRDCGQEIYWIKTAKSGSSVPLNNDFGSHSGGIFDNEGEFHPRGGMGRTSHFETCPSRNAPSNSPKPDRARQWETVSAAMAQTWNLGELREQHANLGRLVGIMDRAGADSETIRRAREVYAACMRKEFGQ